MGLVVYDSLTRRKEPFQTLEPGRVRMYVCGPTVYDKAHVGHAMSSLVFDVVRRYLERKGYRVDHVMNYTDVEDKIIQRARKLGVDPMRLAELYIAEYQGHLAALNVLPATRCPRASQEIPAIVEMVQGLVDGGRAYISGGDVYFRVASAHGYGRLSGRRLDDMRAGARADPEERKDDPADFALWKAAKTGEPAWDSPWGPGRPGWHIECSAMIRRHLGDSIDIHGGGNDLVFPHHENEIAQSEGLTGRPLARFWIHNGMLQLAGEKMSKSLGNLVTVEEFLAHHEADALRLLVLSASYRSPLSFSDEVVGQAERALERLRGALRAPSPASERAEESEGALARGATAAREGFDAAMEDDFDTPAALACLFELTRCINRARESGVGSPPLSEAQALLVELAAVLGLGLRVEQSGRRAAEPFIELLVEVRAALRQAKQWSLADTIRDRLAELGVFLEDGTSGTSWHLR